MAAEENRSCKSEKTLLDHLTKFDFVSNHLKVVGNTSRLMNPTSGGRSSESDVLATHLGMLDCDTLKRLFDRWIWQLHARAQFPNDATQVLCRLCAVQLLSGGGLNSGK